MKEQIIEINMSDLLVDDYDNVMFMEVVAKNDSGLYYLKDTETGEERRLTRTELKHLNADVEKIDDALDMIKHMEFGEVYTDDFSNFFDKPEDCFDEDEIVKITFIKVEA